MKENRQTGVRKDVLAKDCGHYLLATLEDRKKH